jgi:hypothetical protein
MTKLQLEAILRQKNVPKFLYSLDGFKDGMCYCVIRDGESWKVIYVERGRISDVAAVLSEEEAYDVLYKELQLMYGW